jgi:hypothetical protein
MWSPFDPTSFRYKFSEVYKIPTMPQKTSANRLVVFTEEVSYLVALRGVAMGRKGVSSVAAPGGRLHKAAKWSEKMNILNEKMLILPSKILIIKKEIQ